VGAIEVLDPLGEWRVVLSDAGAPAGLPPAPVQRVCATVVPAGASPAALAAALHAAGATATDDAPQRAAVPAGRRALSVLVVDDNRTNLRIAGKVLESGGHVVTLLESAEQALDALEEREFDLVLMDLNMPDVDGFEALKLHRVQSLGRRSVPWAALTADATEEALLRCREAGFADRLIKPLAPEEMLDAVDRLAAPPAQDPIRVAPIASHPRFRSKNQILLDRRMLDRLRKLGGQDFLESVVADFLQDADEIVGDLWQTVETADAAAYRAAAHAMNSAAANVGAVALCDLCRAAKGVGPAVFRVEGREMVERLSAELMRVRPLILQAVAGDDVERGALLH
jgi:two-component system sensor histidine kinase RpfC